MKKWFIRNSLGLATVLLVACENSRDFFDSAISSFDNKNYTSALIAINKAIELSPDSLKYYFVRIAVHDQMGMLTEELTDLDHVINVATNQFQKITAYHQRGCVKMELGRLNEAVEDIDYFINNRDTCGNLAQAYLNKGSILYKLNVGEQARAYYKLAIEHSHKMDKRIRSEALLGFANLAKSDLEKKKYLKEAASADSLDPNVYAAWMSYNYKSGRIREAYLDGIKACQVDPDIYVVNHNLGQIFLVHLNQLDSAKKYFSKAIELAPQTPGVEQSFLNLGIICHRQNDLPAAYRAFKTADSILPSNDLILYNYSLLLSDMKKNDEAIRKMTEAINVNPKDPDYFSSRGAMYMDNLNTENAEKDFKRAIAMGQKSGSAHYNLAYLYGEQQKYEEAIKYYQIAVGRNFDLPATLVNMALLKIKVGKLSSDCADLKRAYKIGRTDIMPLLSKYCGV
jgi:tetratricopeptide (TPR) repeat protein